MGLQNIGLTPPCLLLPRPCDADETGTYQMEKWHKSRTSVPVTVLFILLAVRVIFLGGGWHLGRVIPFYKEIASKGHYSS